MGPFGFDEPVEPAPKAEHETPKKRKSKSIRYESATKRRKHKREHTAAEDEDEKRHVKECNLAQCLQCKYIRNRQAWHKTLPCIEREDINESEIDPQRLAAARQSWLQPCRSPEGGFALMCVPCNTPFAGDVAEQIQICNLKRHHASKEHKANTKTFLGIQLGPTGLPTSGAPAADVFRIAWDAATKGQAIAQGTSDAERKKLTRLWFCLFESLNTKDREFLRHAAVAISRDERKYKLMMRFTACNSDLEVRRGVFWQIQKCPGAGEALTKATMDAFAHFSTPMHGAPTDQKGEAIKSHTVDVELVTHLVEATEVMKVDSASNELWSCAEMKRPGSIDFDGKKIHFKNMVIARDKAHGSRRMHM